ncbi:MAG: toxin-antitoxin system YwqK family antitoxin [Bacteroidales bacterium]
MKSRLILWVLLAFSTALSVYAIFIKPEKFDIRGMAAHLVAQPGTKGTLADALLKKGNSFLIFDSENQLFLSLTGQPYQGLALFYTRNKKLKAWMHFSEGIPSGQAMVYFNNGRAKEISTYVKGIKEGLYKRYNRYGQLLLEGTFHNNLMDGEWKLYFPDGSVRYKALYSQGILREEWFGQFSGYASIPWDAGE